MITKLTFGTGVSIDAANQPVHGQVTSLNVGLPGAKGDTGPGLPAGGTPGQIPVKKSAEDYDTEWRELDITADPLAYYILAKS